MKLVTYYSQDYSTIIGASLAARTAHVSVKSKEICIPYMYSARVYTSVANIYDLLDPTETSDGQHEIKCPYSARTMTPEKELNRFCCSLVAGKVRLKKCIHITSRNKARWQLQTSHGVTFVYGHLIVLL